MVTVNVLKHAHEKLKTKANRGVARVTYKGAGKFCRWGQELLPLGFFSLGARDVFTNPHHVSSLIPRRFQSRYCNHYVQKAKNLSQGFACQFCQSNWPMNARGRYNP